MATRCTRDNQAFQMSWLTGKSVTASAARVPWLVAGAVAEDGGQADLILRWVVSLRTKYPEKGSGRPTKAPAPGGFLRSVSGSFALSPAGKFVNRWLKHCGKSSIQWNHLRNCIKLPKPMDFQVPPRSTALMCPPFSSWWAHWCYV